MIDWDSIVLAPTHEVFGEAVLYRPISGAPFTIPDAVYDANYSRSEVDANGVTLTVSFPVLGVRTAIVQPVQGDRLKIISTGESYAVSDVIPDGHGHVLLKLDASDAAP